MLTRGDDYPLHQTADPVAYAGTDRNFYDRYFFNGYPAEQDDDRMFGVAFGVYPQLNLADAAFSWMAGGRQVSLHASRWLDMERLALEVGPVRIAVEEPLRRLRVTVDAPDHGIAADLRFTGRHFPLEEPRFTRRVGPRVLLDYTRLTQNGRYDGWIEVDGERTEVTGFVGTRDRSWGVRPVGARDPQGVVPPAMPQFFWLWSPCAFPDGDLFLHTNDDADGAPWNRRAAWMPTGTEAGGERHLADPRFELRWRPGTRTLAGMTVRLGGGTLRFEPGARFQMLGLGYGHPTRAHGTGHGALSVVREELAGADPALPHHFHVQALSRVAWTDADGRERAGRGVLEQLAIGPYAPAGLTGIADLAR